MDATRYARAQGAQHIAEKGPYSLFICSSCTQPQAKAAVAAPRELSFACCSGEATDMDPASASGRHMLDQPAAQAIASSKQSAADVECGDSLPQPIKGQVVSGGLYDDERRLTSWRHYACLGLVVSILIGLAVGMICVGVIPAQNYQASSSVFKSAGVKRTYYLSVEEVNWTYTPGGKDKIWAPLYGTYLNHTAPESAILGNFIKAHYVAYTDDTFTVRPGIPDPVHSRTSVWGWIIRARRDMDMQGHTCKIVAIPCSGGTRSTADCMAALCSPWIVFAICNRSRRTSVMLGSILAFLVSTTTGARSHVAADWVAGFGWMWTWVPAGYALHCIVRQCRISQGKPSSQSCVNHCITLPRPMQAPSCTLRPVTRLRCGCATCLPPLSTWSPWALHGTSTARWAPSTPASLAGTSSM